MKTLIVDDDFASRLVLQTYFSRYGDCHVAVNGREAVEAVGAAARAGSAYDLVCMDIMMPEMDGQAAVRAIRNEEREAAGGTYTTGVRIIMTTALCDIANVSEAYQGLCDGYLRKPIHITKLEEEMRILGLAAGAAVS